MKRVLRTVLFILLTILLLAGCKIETAEQHAANASAEMSAAQSVSAPAVSSAASSSQTASSKAGSSSSQASKTVSSASSRKAPSSSAQSVSSQKTQSVKPAAGPSVTISINCINAVNWYKQNGKAADPAVVPADGVILPATSLTLKTGDTVYSILKRVTTAKGIQFSDDYGGGYISGIHNLYRGALGAMSGWMFSVNGKFPGTACNEYKLSDGDKIRWDFTVTSGDLKTDGAG